MGEIDQILKLVSNSSWTTNAVTTWTRPKNGRSPQLPKVVKRRMRQDCIFIRKHAHYTT